MRSIECAVLAGAFIVGCGSDPKPPPAAPGGGTDDSTVAPTASEDVPTNEVSDEKDPNKSQINISEEIRKACGITNDEAFFGYDSANVRHQDHPVLLKLAQCFIDGPLAGRKMRLVGHADPRGDEEYNMVLGDKRAGSVKNFLTGKGLSGDKVEASSRGELDATGTDEASWFRDRRVDVMLAN